MQKLSCRERLRRVYRREPVDRVPIRLWGVYPSDPPQREDYPPLYELIERHELDLVRSYRHPPERIDPPVCPSHTEAHPSEHEDLDERVTVQETPAGPLTTIRYVFKDGRPGYMKKYPIETPEDAQKWLSIPTREPAFQVDSYWDMEREAGERAMVMVGLDHSLYAAQRLMGSEIFGFWLIEHRGLLHEMVSRTFAQVEAEAKRYLALGVGECFGWVGPELCIPPLASPRDFQEFVFDYDKRIIDLLHDAGKFVWVHCHGDMDPVLEGFADMGVDCLNPIEPPPTGRLTLAEAQARVGDRMTLEGGVQNGDFDVLDPHELAPVVEAAMAQGKPGGGYILCPTSGPSTWTKLSERHLANYRVFVETAIARADYD